MFDWIFDDDKDEEEHIFNLQDEFESTIEPMIAELFAKAEEIGMPLIILGCVSHEVQYLGKGKSKDGAGMLCAAHGRPDKEGPWFPDIMKLVLGLLSDPKLVHVIDGLLPIIRMMADSTKGDDDESARVRGFGTADEFMDFLKGGRKGMEDYDFGFHFDEDDEEDDEEE